MSEVITFTIQVEWDGEEDISDDRLASWLDRLENMLLGGDCFSLYNSDVGREEM